MAGSYYCSSHPNLPGHRSSLDCGLTALWPLYHSPQGGIDRLKAFFDAYGAVEASSMAVMIASSRCER